MPVTINRIEGLSELQADIVRMSRAARFDWPNFILDETAEIIKMEIERRAPGGIAESVDIDKGPDMRTVFVWHVAGVFQNDGTQPSPGRYIPAIRKRKITPPLGIHPGVRALKFFERAIDASDLMIDKMHRDWLNKRGW